MSAVRRRWIDDELSSVRTPRIYFSMLMSLCVYVCGGSEISFCSFWNLCMSSHPALRLGPAHCLAVSEHTVGVYKRRSSMYASEME